MIHVTTELFRVRDNIGRTGQSVLQFLTIIILAACSMKSTQSQDGPYGEMKKAFLNPTTRAKPKVYWWCLNGNIDTLRAKDELIAMQEAGIGGFDFFEIGVPKYDTMIPGGPAFLSDESLGIIKYVVGEAGRLDLNVGLNLASSWNAGGSWIKPEHGGKSLYFSETRVYGDTASQLIKISFPKVEFPQESLIGGTDEPMIPFRQDGKPQYFEEVAILAIPASAEKFSLDTAMVIDLSGFFTADEDLLKWQAPPGAWKILRYICSNSGQQLVLPSPESAGLTVDHFDSIAVRTHIMHIIHRLQSVLGDFQNTALKSFYLASYEARGFVWTSTLKSEFKEINGYDISKLIPVLFDKELFAPDVTKMADLDFKKTLSELMINNLYRNSKEICSEYGLEINCEAGGPGFPLYNGPAEPLKALGALDIPRGEFWVNHSRFYKDGKDSIDILRVVKEVSAASHIYQRGIVEEEAFTSFQHWQEGPYDIKPFGDRAFCEGMNRVVFHGFSHNPAGTGFPGIVYHAGTHFNDKRVWWSKARPFILYLTRLSSVFQQADFVADVLLYYGDKVPNSATPKNTHFSVGPGYDYEVINTDILLKGLKFEQGKLALSNGATFSLLALEYEENINPLVLLKLKDLADQGAVIVGDKPKGMSNNKNRPLSHREGITLIEQLWGSDDDNEADNKIISTVRPLEMLQKIEVQPDFIYEDNNKSLLDFIHYNNGDIDFYFVSNYSSDWISRACGFRQQNKTPEIWDSQSGEIVPVSIYDQDETHVNIPITLPPYGSQMIVFKSGLPKSNFTGIAKIDQTIPHLEYTQNGVIVLEDTDFQLNRSDQVKWFRNSIERQTLEGSWELTFPEGWGALSNMFLPELTSWTDSKDEGVKYFSGTCTYKKSFEYNRSSNISDEHRTYLCLGDLSKIGEVWLNGQGLGIAWSKPYRFDVTEVIKPGENQLIVEVANTWSNRLVGDAITGQDYTHTNIRNTVLPTVGIKTSGQSRVPWKDVPLIESGLLGPVTIATYSTWNPNQ